ncbi:MAG: hypothetical protein FJ286_10035 [Planctomycetes bacterium]|nr:hypothetical protein [Planctomycetota bacterium]
MQLAAAPEADLVQIEQQPTRAVLTVASGERVLRLSISADAALGTVQPFTISASDFARAAKVVGASPPGPAGELPLVVLRVSADVAGIVGPSGSPQTVTIVQTRFPDYPGKIDRVEGELASGMTQAVAAAHPRHVLELAEAAMAIGCTAVQFTFAPRFGLVLAEADAQGMAATMVLADHEHAERLAPPPMQGDALVFTMPETKPRRTARRSPQKLQEFQDGELPF